ncbi:hypothetical protein BCR44DRAFT_1423573 [Catenaria anguillulae PL171]|uniref:Uncharacterized protein n=1 Tax=Catenaria anguillulae PL171 TaxID=765915 RepID=A0A1Y2I1C5_9FUNG|nr:hypothetical protein BCR44DRAFT_1423573 [Catenaria anguillulae PL171]
MDPLSLAADSLPLELVERLIAVAIHVLQCRPGRHGPDAWAYHDVTDTNPLTNPLHTLLCALGPRRDYPDITLAAFSRCWWVDLDCASAIGDIELLNVMDRLAQTAGARASLSRRPLQWTHVAMDQSSKKGFVHVLDWWYKRFGAACWYTEAALTGAAEAGHLDALKWWVDRKDGLSCELNNKILLHATLGGHLDICEWWLTHHCNERNPSDAYRMPVMHGLLHALVHAIRSHDTEFRMFHWWLAQPFCRAPKVRHLKRASYNQLKDLQVAIWTHRETSTEVIARIPDLMDSVDVTLPVQVAAGMCAGVLPGDGATKLLDAHAPRVWEAFVDLVAMASLAGHVHVLDWFVRQPLLGKLDQGMLATLASMSISSALGAGHVHVLDWWVSACPWLDTVREALSLDTQSAVREASQAGHVHVLGWWKSQSPFPYSCGPFTLQAAAQAGHVSVLEWWLESDKNKATELRARMNDVIRAASSHNQVCVLDWWSQQQHFTKTSGDTMATITAASFSGSIDALQWWAATDWFVDWHERGNAMFSLDLPRPQTFDWWIEYLWTDQTSLQDPERHSNFHYQLFLALVQSHCTILLHKYVRRFGFPNAASKAVLPGEPHLADQVGLKSLQKGHVCTKPDPVVVETHISQTARHVKAWLTMKGIYSC